MRWQVHEEQRKVKEEKLESSDVNMNENFSTHELSDALKTLQNHKRNVGASWHAPQNKLLCIFNNSWENGDHDPYC